MGGGRVELPGEIGELRSRIEAWRSLKGSRVERMPDELWSEATEWARRFGASAVGRALGIGYVGLRQRLAGGADTKAGSSVLSGGFVELGTWAGGGVLRVEADRGDGCRLRLEVAPGTGEDAAALLGAFLRRAG